MNNVLFIVYYFPPMGGSGVQRPLKFIKYLRECGWNPIVVCPHPGAYHTFDESLHVELQELDVEVHRVEGNTPFHKTGQAKKNVNLPGILSSMLRWFSSLFFLPDNKKNWIEPGFKKAKELAASKNIDLIFGTAPPYSNLMLARKLRDETGIPVVMDLRDDWVGSHLITYPTSWHKKQMIRIEAETLEHADQLLTVNEEIADSINRRIKKNVKVLGHGFDPEDFTERENLTLASPKKLSFLYSGTFYPESGPDNFLKAVSELVLEDPKLKEFIELQFQGGLDSKNWKLINKLGLTDMVVDYGYVKHDIAVRNLMKADILWLVIGHQKKSKIISLGKTSEYFATRKPILGLVPEGSAKRMLKKYGNSFIAEPYNIADIKGSLIEIMSHYEKEKSWPKPDEAYIESFNRKKLTQKLAVMFDEIIA
jgi:glycosyltransferase involved in cell wall biosynthesis